MSDSIDTLILQAIADARAAARDCLPHVDQALLACGAPGIEIDRDGMGRAAREGTIFDGLFLDQLKALGDALETVVEAGTHRAVNYVDCGLDDCFFPVACRSPQAEHAADLRFRLRRSSDTIHRAEDLIAARRMLEGRR